MNATDHMFRDGRRRRRRRLRRATRNGIYLFLLQFATIGFVVVGWFIVRETKFSFVIKFNYLTVALRQFLIGCP